MPPELSLSGIAGSKFHTVFSAECNPTFDWHSIALFHSHAISGQPGGVTRLLACSEEKLRTYQGLDIGPTFVHPNHRGLDGMNYAAYNKPASVSYWVHSDAVPAGVEFVMQLDADMLIHRPVHPEILGVKPGVVVSAPYSYLVGTHSGLADVFGIKNKSLMVRASQLTAVCLLHASVARYLSVDAACTAVRARLALSPKLLPRVSGTSWRSARLPH